MTNIIKLPIPDPPEETMPACAAIAVGFGLGCAVVALSVMMLWGPGVVWIMEGK